MIQHNKFANDCNHMYRAWLMKHWLFTLNKKIRLSQKISRKYVSRNSAEKIRLAENWAAFLKASQILPKNSAEMYLCARNVSFNSVRDCGSYSKL